MSKPKRPFWLNSKKKLEVVPPIPKPRSSEEIRVDYSTKCANIGERQYKIKLMEAEMGQLYQEVQQLTRDYAEAQSREAKEAQEKQNAAPKADDKQPA